MREALNRLDPLWDELFLSEQTLRHATARGAGRCQPGRRQHPAADQEADETGYGSARRQTGRTEGSVMAKPKISSDGRTITVRVPISIRERGGRKLVLAPDGAECTVPPVTRHVDNALVKAIARAFRWREMLEDGSHATIAEIAAAEKINEAYVGRVLRQSLADGSR